MDITGRFAGIVRGPESEVALDELALLIAAHGHPHVDVDVQMARLDHIAAAVPDQSLDGVVDHLFVELGFTGNTGSYHEAENSFLDVVLDRQMGIPITLAVLLISIARRLDIDLAGVGMPGHFLVRDLLEPPTFIDPFHGGTRLDRDGCQEMFRRLHGTEQEFRDEYLAPVGARLIGARMLANLQQIYRASNDRRNLEWVCRLKAKIPGLEIGGGRVLAAVLAADGRFDEAAATLEEVSSLLGGDERKASEAAAVRLRARLN